MNTLRTMFAFTLLALAFSALADPAPRYDLTLRIDPEQRSLAVEGTARLAPSDKPKTEITFALAEQMTDVEVEVLEPKESAGKVELAKLGTEDRQTAWSFKPALPIPAGAQTTVRFAFRGGGRTAFVFHIGPRGCFAGGGNTPWYPQFGRIAVVGGKVEADVVERGVGHLRMIVPSGFTAMACGAKAGQSKDGDHDVFDYNVTTPSTLGFAVARFVVHRVEGGIPVSVFFFKDRKNIDDYVNGCHKVIDQLVKIYGKFPFAEFAVVEVDDLSAREAGFSGASLPGFMLANGAFLDEPFNLAYFGHEIGHTWWGNVVTNNGPDGHFLMDEAMAQYGSLRVVEAMDGPAMAARYRHTGYPGYISEQCGDGFLEIAGAGLDHRLADLPYGNNNSHLLADCKGFLVFDQLTHVIGRPAFDAALREVVRKHSFAGLSWTEFKAEVDRQAHQDLSWFWDQWMNRTGAPVLGLSWQTDGGSVSGVLTQTAPAYRLNVPVRIEYADGSMEMRRLDSSATETPFRFEARKPVKTVEADPNYEIEHFTPETLAEWTAMAPLTKARALMQQSKRDEAKTLLEDQLKNLPSPDPYGVEFGVHYSLGQLAQALDPTEGRRQMELALACPVRLERRLADCYLRLAQISLKLGDKPRARWAAEACLSWEKRQGEDGYYSTQARAILKQLEAKADDK